MKNLELKFCECGCGQKVSRLGSRFISGHNRRGATNSPKHNTAISRANSGENNPSKRPEVRKKMSEAHIGKKLSKKHVEGISKSLKNNSKVAEAAKKRSKWCPPPRVVWTKEMREAQRKRRIGTVSSPATKQKTSESMLEYYLIPENRLKKAIETSRRILNKKSPFDLGHIYLPRLEVTVLHRSSYEKDAFFLLDSLSEVHSILVEGIYITYIDENGSPRIYVPDVLVTTVDKQRFLIEIKPLGRVLEVRNQLKFSAALDWAKSNNAIFCIWTEEILYGDSVTTTSLQAIVEATVADPLGRRYSLNSMEQHREGSRNVSLAC